MLGRSRKADTTNEWISRALGPGSYYVRVVAQELGKNQYVLRYGVKNLSTTAQGPDQETLIIGLMDPRCCKKYARWANECVP